MKAMILAAGLGTRLRPLTYKIPKILVPIGNRPHLEYVLKLLKKHNFKNVAINLHHFREKFLDYFKKRKKDDLKIHPLFEEKLSGTAGPVKKLERYFKDGPFLVYYGDNLTNLDLSKMISFHQKKKGIATIALYYEKNPREKGIVFLDKNDRILKFIEKPKGEITIYTANAGIYVLEPEIFKFIKKGFFDFGKDIFPKLLAAKKKLYGFKIPKNTYFIDIGSLKTYKKANSDVLKKKLKI